MRNNITIHEVKAFLQQVKYKPSLIDSKDRRKLLKYIKIVMKANDDLEDEVEWAGYGDDL